MLFWIIIFEFVSQNSFQQGSLFGDAGQPHTSGPSYRPPKVPSLFDKG